jgi:phosphoribosyl-AMP cyclohydrolase / phosphoribosyl-ATP pyrophosphohydrolase
MSAKDVPWPVLVRIGGPDDAVIVTVLMNRKAYRKSLETGTPWIFHPTTGRVLSWPGEPKFSSLGEGPGRFELSLPSGTEVFPYGRVTPPDVDPDDRSEMNVGDGSVESSGEAGNRGKTSDSPGRSTGAAEVMDRLFEVIADRRRTMPEGSYTTLLFEKGLDKIRKKVGEEAVELLLARNPKDVVYEAADLIYHLLVLLEASDLSWSDVVGELDRRHG